MDRGLCTPLGSPPSVETFWFNLGHEGRSINVWSSGAVLSCSLLLGGSCLGKSKVEHLLPQDTGQDLYRLRFTMWLILPICKVDV